MQEGGKKNPPPGPVPAPRKRFSEYKKYNPSFPNKEHKKEDIKKENPNQVRKNSGIADNMKNMKAMLEKRGGVGGFGAPRHSAQIMGMPFGMPMPNKGTNKNVDEKPKIEEREPLDKTLDKIAVQKNKKKMKRPDF